MATVKIVPFGVSDMRVMDVQERYVSIIPHVWRNLLMVEQSMVGPWSWTMWSVHGRALCACGILSDGGAWAFLSPHIRPHLLAATRRTHLELQGHLLEKGPVYAEVDRTHLQALRWVKLLGFRHDAGERWVFD